MLSEPCLFSEAAERPDRCRCACSRMRRERDELQRLIATMRAAFRLIGEALIEAEMVIDEMSCYSSETPEDIAWRLRELLSDATALAGTHESEEVK